MSENDQTSGAIPPTPPPPPPSAAGPTGPTPPAGPTGPTGQHQRPQDRFFDSIRRSGWHRSERRVIGGVSGGIAERTGIDVTVIRVLTVVMTIFGGLGLLAYGLAWLLLPEPDGRIHADQVLRGDLSAGAIGSIVTSVLGFGGLGGSWHGPFGWHANGFGWFWGLSGTALFIGLVGLVIYAIANGRGRPGSGGGTPYSPAYPQSFPPAPSAPGSPTTPATAPYATAPTEPYGAAPTYPAPPAPPYGAGGGAGTGTGTATLTAPAAAPAPMGFTPTPARQRRPSFGGFGALAVAGAAAVGAGITALVMSNSHYDASTSVTAWAVALAVISAALVVGGLAGRRAGVLTLFAIIATTGTLLAMVPANLSHMQGAGDRTWRPATTADAEDGYGVGAGDGTLDLTGLDRSSLTALSPADISASVGFGRLTVMVPADMTVKIRASVGAGEVASVDAVDQAIDRTVFVGDDNEHGASDGIGVHRTSVVGSGPVVVVVDAKVGFGRVRIEQVP